MREAALKRTKIFRLLSTTGAAACALTLLSLPSYSEDVADPLTISSVSPQKVIVIDPGHGGMDTGAHGSDLQEKQLVFDVALIAKESLEKDKGYKIELTRSEDVFVPLAKRTSFANDKKADLFISLHANASPKQNAQGLETFYLDTTSDKASRRLAERENASLRFENNADGDIAFILSDLIQTGKLEDSIKLAHSVHSSIKDNAKRMWQEARDLGVKKGPFYVLVGAHMPCILVELFFIDHPIDGKYLGQPDFKKTLGEGLAEGIRNFFTQKNIRQPAT